VNDKERLDQLDRDFFVAMHEIDPLTATQLGVFGYDHLLPDPSRSGAEAGAARLAALEARLQAIHPEELGARDQVNRDVMAHLIWALRTNLEDGIWAKDASAGTYTSPQSMAFASIPGAPLPGADAVAGYLQRLAALPEFFDAVRARYQEEAAAGWRSTEVGIRQAQEQLQGHLARAVTADPLLAPLVEAAAATPEDRGRAEQVILSQVRPAMVRLLRALSDDLLPSARPDNRVGICHLSGGREMYRRAVRRHTTTLLDPEEIHQIGLGVLEALEAEWEEVGSRAFGKALRAEEVRARLREDPALRFQDEGQILAVVTAALERAEASRDAFFPAFRIARCVIQPIDPVEAGNAPMAYYRGPSADGTRPGTHFVLTTEPTSRFTYEYEALAFHESTPGHHLQIASAQTLSHLPMYRRHLDVEVCAYVEGWGLYAERLADEMGLYTSDLMRLGMLSFDALRACRLVVDSGMHHLGWERQQAVDFMWRSTATNRSNVENEIDRYIAWPGQALAYMIGRREIRRLRDTAETRLGAVFDVRAFHGAVLSEGAVPLSVLEDVVERWMAAPGGGGADGRPAAAR
jgi:uncharacterized protein (DUF885 family)